MSSDWLSKDELKAVFAEKVAERKKLCTDNGADEAIISLLLMVKEMKEIGLPVELESMTLVPYCLFAAVPDTTRVVFSGMLHLNNTQVLLGVTLQNNDVSIAILRSDWRYQDLKDAKFLTYAFLRNSDCIAEIQTAIVEALANDAVVKDLDDRRILLPLNKKPKTSNVIIS